MRFFLLLITLLFSGLSSAASVLAESGSVYYKSDDGVRHQLTSAHADSRPILSPDGKTVVFLREKPGKRDDLMANESEIWTVQVSGENAHLLLDIKEDSEPEKTLSYFNHLSFSSDGQKLYFQSAAWVTSNAVDVLDMKTGAVTFISDGNAYYVISKGRYAGHLVVQKHKYYKNSGSYDYFWLITPEGREIRMVGKTEKQAERFVKSQ